MPHPALSCLPQRELEYEQKKAKLEAAVLVPFHNDYRKFFKRLTRKEKKNIRSNLETLKELLRRPANEGGRGLGDSEIKRVIVKFDKQGLLVLHWRGIIQVPATG